MGFLLGLSGHKRYATRHSKFLWHDGTSGALNSSAKVRDEIEFQSRNEDRVRQYILEHTKIDPELYDSKLRVEWYMFADEASMVNQKNGTGYITCITDTFLRGSTLDNAVIIIDESQNYTVSQLKTVLTRVGSNAKVVVIGHELQCDLDEPARSGFKDYIEHFSDQERTAFCSLVNNYRSWISRHADEL